MKPTFFAFMENVIGRMIELKHIGTAKNYRSALNSFQRYADASLRGLRSPLYGDRKLLGHHPALCLSKTTDIPIEAIDHILIEDYQDTYDEKAERFVRNYGGVNFAPGGSLIDVAHVWKKYGAVPEEVYTGLQYGEDKHVHGELVSC